MVGFDARTQQGAALRPTSHFVYESIYTAILEKRLAPAAKLSKETLGQIFRVSNGTIQRALTRLAEDGAVVMPPKEVASVARPDERQARQVLDARLLVESEVVRQRGAGSRRPCRATGAGRRGAGLPRGPRQRRADPSRRALPPAPGRTDRESLAAGFRPWPGGTRLAGHRAEQGAVYTAEAPRSAPCSMPWRTATARRRLR